MSTLSVALFLIGGLLVIAQACLVGWCIGFQCQICGLPRWPGELIGGGIGTVAGMLMHLGVICFAGAT